MSGADNMQLEWRGRMGEDRAITNLSGVRQHMVLEKPFEGVAKPASLGLLVGRGVGKGGGGEPG